MIRFIRRIPFCRKYTFAMKKIRKGSAYYFRKIIDKQEENHKWQWKGKHFSRLSSRSSTQSFLVRRLNCHSICPRTCIVALEIISRPLLATDPPSKPSCSREFHPKSFVCVLFRVKPFHPAMNFLPVSGSSGIWEGFAVTPLKARRNRALIPLFLKLKERQTGGWVGCFHDETDILIHSLVGKRIRYI